jgi:hypothetical protein
VLFVNYEGALYALKELHAGAARLEHDLLASMEDLGLPAVEPVGHALVETAQGKASVLITHYLERSLPYRTLFMIPGLRPYRRSLLDAMASLLVQLHLAGVYWGDCSLSNTLFRRDAGALQAYLVDAETSEVYDDPITPTLRFHDLEILEENVDGELLDLRSEGMLRAGEHGLPPSEVGATIRLSYQRLWEEITREEVINRRESYRIQERIRSLNALGFSVGDVELAATEGGDQLRLRVIVTDRSFHRDQLFNLTGLDAEEMQARKMMNEIQEVRATLSRDGERSVPLSVAGSNWLEKRYQPVVKRLDHLVGEDTSQAELYCQVLENKWYLSERAQRDVGHEAATEDYLQRYSSIQEA